MTTSGATSAYVNREQLTTKAYADPTNLGNRISIYRHQNPRHDLREHVTRLLHDVGPGTRILEVGSGPGHYSRALRADRPDRLVIATDLSHGMAMAAAECAHAAVADATALPFAAGTFDAVTALHMLYHVPVPAQALTEIARVVRPGGTVLISTNAIGDKLELHQLHARAATAAGHLVPDEGLSKRFNLDEAETVARQHFAIVERSDLRSIIDVPDVAPIVAFIESCRSWYDDNDEVLDHVRRLADETIAAEGAFRIRSHMGFLVCR